MWQYLPKDLLHCLYCEWLTWSDLSVLDIVCLGEEDREEWLSSLSSLVMTAAQNFDHVPDQKLVNYYKWLGNRKVLIRDGLVLRMSLLQHLLLCCDPVTFCSALHSILIIDDDEKVTASPDASDDDNSDSGLSLDESESQDDSSDSNSNSDGSTEEKVSYDDSTIELSLSSFLSHCSHLEAVKVNIVTSWNKYDCGRQDDILYTALNNQLQDNQLVKLDIVFDYHREIVLDKIVRLLSKNVNSLKEIRIVDSSEDCCGVIYVLKSLIASKHTLRVLGMYIDHYTRNDTIPILLQYLSAAGMFLESYFLRSAKFSINFIFTHELLMTIGTSCPNLVELSWSASKVDENLKPIEIYRLCPNFKHLTIDNFFMMNVDEEKNRLNFHTTLNKLTCALLEGCMDCVLLSLQRGQYSELGLTTHCGLEVEEWTLITRKVGSVLTSLCVHMSEDALISLLPNLPRLQELDVEVIGAFTDSSLAAIAGYGEALTNLRITKVFGDASKIEFSDEMICEVIRKCKMLEVLEIPCVGCESILCAARYLPRLRWVTFECVRASRKSIFSLLCGGEVRWSSCLRQGSIGDFLEYNPHSRSWVDIK
eukprot:scaffold2953_cov187-Ochromonas_danica.AAC.4